MSRGSVAAVEGAACRRVLFHLAGQRHHFAQRVEVAPHGSCRAGPGLLVKRFDCGRGAVGVASVDHDLPALRQQGTGGGEADTLGGAGD